MSVTNILDWAANGLRSVQIGGIGDTGFLAGYGNQTAADEGEMSGLRRLNGAVTAPTPLPGSTQSYNRGEDGYLEGFEYDAQPSAFELVLEATPLDVAAWLRKLSLYVNSAWSEHGDGGSTRTYRNTFTHLTRNARSLADDSRGAPGFDNLLIFSTKYTRRRGDAAFQAAGQNTLSGLPSRVVKTPWGTSTLSVYSQIDMMTLEYWSENPSTHFAFIGDGTTDGIPLPYTPIDTASIKLWNFATGAALTVSSVDTGADTVTVSAAPSAGAIIVGRMESLEA